MKNFKYIKPFVLAFLLITSCSDDILEKSSPNQLSTENFLQNRIQAEAAVNAIYAGLQANQLYNREYFFVQDLLSDDVASGGGQLEGPRALVLSYGFDGSNPLFLAVWSGLYRIVHRANFVISKIDEVPEIEISAGDRDRFEGEARFLRAWAYFDIVSLWGPAPLLTEPADDIEGFPRSSEEEIYALILNDLTLAEEKLPLKSEYAKEDLGRATRGAAQALAARVHLFRGEYEQAKGLLQKVISSNEYALHPVYIENFREEFENNIESIFEVQFTEAAGNADAWNGDGRGVAEITFRGQEYGPNAWRNIVPNPDLKAAFEEGDPRQGYSFYEAGETYFGTDDDGSPNTLTNGGWKKYQTIYKREQENMRSGINFRVIRYADVLLMMAEVVNETEGPAAAMPYVDQVRTTRPSVQLEPLAVPASNEDMFEIIMHERRVELAGEQIRNRDLRRWHKHGKINMGDYLGEKFQSHEILLPIPTAEIDRNSALSSSDQNPGYN